MPKPQNATVCPTPNAITDPPPTTSKPYRFQIEIPAEKGRMVEKLVEEYAARERIKGGAKAKSGARTAWFVAMVEAACGVGGSGEGNPNPGATLTHATRLTPEECERVEAWLRLGPPLSDQEKQAKFDALAVTMGIEDGELHRALLQFDLGARAVGRVRAWMEQAAA